MEKRKGLITGCIIALISFAFILIGMKILNSGAVTAQNIVAYVVFSLILGIIAILLQYLKLDFVLLFFIGGIGIGFFKMFTSFGDKTSGWGDLAGIAYLITYIALGLLVGIIVQTYIWLVNKIKRNK